MAAYYLTVGDRTHGSRLPDRHFEQLEQAEHEAIEELKRQLAQGHDAVIVRVVEVGPPPELVVYAVHQGNVGPLV